MLWVPEHYCFFSSRVVEAMSGERTSTFAESLFLLAGERVTSPTCPFVCKRPPSSTHFAPPLQCTRGRRQSSCWQACWDRLHGLITEHASVEWRELDDSSELCRATTARRFAIGQVLHNVEKEDQKKKINLIYSIVVRAFGSRQNSQPIGS